MRIQQALWRMCFCGLGSLALVSGVSADDPDPVREFANRIREQLRRQQAEAAGQKPEEEQDDPNSENELTERQKQVLRIQQEVQRKIREAQERANQIQMQAEKESRDLREDGERQLLELRRRVPMEGRPGPRPPHRPDGRAGVDPRLRIQHLQRAADNLQSAGLTEEGERLRQRAEELQKELDRELPPGDEAHHAVVREIHELRRSVDALRHEVHELRRELTGHHHGPGHHPHPPHRGMIDGPHDDGDRPMPLGRPHRPEVFPGPGMKPPHRPRRGVLPPSSSGPESRSSEQEPTFVPSSRIPSSQLDEPVPDSRPVPGQGKAREKDSEDRDEAKASDRDDDRPKRGKPEKSKKDDREKPEPQDD